MRLAGVLHSFTVCQSGQHEIEYVVGVDHDDQWTIDTVFELISMYQGLHMKAHERLPTLGESWNCLAAGREWDTCCVIADKHLCLTPNWDLGIAQMAAAGVPAARWNLLRAPEETALILSRRLYDVTGRVFPEFFPFWFSERWVFEVHQLAFGKPIPLVRDLMIHEPAGRTQGLRDLEFWFDFFARSRGARIEEADAVCKAYGHLAPPGRANLLAEMQAHDEWQKPRIAGYYELRGNAEGPPTPQYEEAKRRAAAWLKDRSLLEMEVCGAA